MNLLVTGAAGFIGSNFVRLLSEVRPDYKIIAYDLLTYAGNLENIADLVDSGKISFVRADIGDRKQVAAAVEEHQIDLIVHFAAESHVDRSIIDAQPFVRTNLLGTQILLDVASEFKVKRFLHVSTDEVYGSLGAEGRFYENTPLDPSSPYSASKAGSDLLVMAAHRTRGLDAIVTRCTNNYGPYQFPEKLIPLFVTNALDGKKLPLYGDGMNVRSWLHVRDHSEALLVVAEKGRSGEVYNIGCSVEGELTNKEVTSRVLELLKLPESLIIAVADRPGHDRRYAVDTAKIRSELGWVPKISFEEGLAATVLWYKENRSWWERIKSGEYLRYYQANYGDRMAQY